MKNTNYNIRICKDINKELINAWEDLWQRSDNASVFNSYSWFKTNQTTMNIKNFEIVVCFREKQLVAVLPLYFTKKFGIKTSISLDYKPASTPFLFENYDPKLFKYFFDFLRQKKSFYLAKVHMDAIKILYDYYPNMLYSLISVDPYLNKKKHPDLINSNTNHKNTRKLIKRYAHQLKFENYDQTHNLKHYLDQMFNLEQKSRKKQRKMDIFSSTSTREFFKNIVKYCKPFIKIHFIYFNNQPIGYTFNLAYKKRIFGYQIAYLADQKKLSPGKMLILHVIEILKYNGYSQLEMGGGISSYKLEYAPDYYYLYDIYHSDNPLIMFWWRLINSARRMKQILFPLKHTRDHEFLFRVYPSLPDTAITRV